MLHEENPFEAFRRLNISRNVFTGGIERLGDASKLGKIGVIDIEWAPKEAGTRTSTGCQRHFWNSYFGRKRGGFRCQENPGRRCFSTPASRCFSTPASRCFERSGNTGSTRAQKTGLTPIKPGQPN